MFRGSSFHTIDAKGRIIIPTRFREFISSDGRDGVMVTTFDNCLYAYPFEEWYKLETKILSLPDTSEYMRRFRRIFIGMASECPCDKQDRILIPQSLRELAGFEKELAIVGVLNYFEIWSREKWEKEYINLEHDMQREEFRNEIAKLGI
jgi:MraZ protein